MCIFFSFIQPHLFIQLLVKAELLSVKSCTSAEVQAQWKHGLCVNSCFLLADYFLTCNVPLEGNHCLWNLLKTTTTHRRVAASSPPLPSYHQKALFLKSPWSIHLLHSPKFKKESQSRQQNEGLGAALCCDSHANYTNYTLRRRTWAALFARNFKSNHWVSKTFTEVHPYCIFCLSLSLR